jgi:hypothetical protein
MVKKLMEIISETMERDGIKLDKDYVNVFRFNDCMVFYYYDEETNAIKIDVENLGTHNFYFIDKEFDSLI